MQHLTSGRRFGFLGTTVSQGDFASPLSPEGPEAFEAYRKRLVQVIAEGYGVGIRSIAHAGLCHGSKVEVFLPGMGDAFFPQTDGLVCAEPYMALVVTGADCPPVFLYDSRRRVIGLAHSGREGTRKNIAASLLHAMEQRYDCSVDDIQATIGPGICQEHYQVPPEMATAFGTELGFDTWAVREGHGYVDLPGTIRCQLLQQGVHPSRILRSAHPCTFECPDWHSYRRDKTQDVLTPQDRPRVSAYVAMMF